MAENPFILSVGTAEYEFTDHGLTIKDAGITFTTQHQSATPTASTIAGAHTVTNQTWGSGSVSSLETGSTGTALRNYGVSTIVCSTSPTALAYTLAAPVAGMFKTIANISAGSTGTATVTTAATTRFLGPAGTIATFSSGGSVTLFGVTSSSWSIVSYSTSVTLS